MRDTLKSVRSVKGILIRLTPFRFNIDHLASLITVVGDLFDFGFKANLRNIDLLRKRLRGSGSDDVRIGRTDSGSVTR